MFGICWNATRRLKGQNPKMTTDRHTFTPLLKLILCAWALAGCTTSQKHTTPPEGTWVCRAEWACTYEGTAARCSVEQHTTCSDNVLSVRGVLSIGAAQWSETKAGSCHASGAELFGTWTASQTDPQNDAARQFERKTLGGKSLGTKASEMGQEYRVRVTSRSATEFKAVNAEGRVIACTRH
jgi:hypothetical protein